MDDQQTLHLVYVSEKAFVDGAWNGDSAKSSDDSIMKKVRLLKYLVSPLIPRGAQPHHCPFRRQENADILCSAVSLQTGR